MEPKLDPGLPVFRAPDLITVPVKEARALWQSLKGEAISVIGGVGIGQSRGVCMCVCVWLTVGDTKHKILNSVISKHKMG